MESMTDPAPASYQSFFRSMGRLFDINLKLIGAVRERMKVQERYARGLTTYINQFMTPCWISLNKGHSAIATSWSLPTSECALHTCFGDGCRGPVRYQLDFEKGGVT